jgi:hypothetical protein
MSAAEIAALLFTGVNCVRVLAYVPQVVRIARDRGGAEAISLCAWGLFALSHLSTIVYALFALGDARMAAIFAANLAACGLVIAFTAWKRAAQGGRHHRC